jgi:sortase B
MEDNKKKSSKGRKVRRTAENVIIICLAAIVLFSGYKVFTIVRGYMQQQNAYDNISDKAQSGGFTGDIDFEALRKINPDVVGWLYYEGSPINYPIVKGDDNDKYLKTMFDGSYGSFGTLFVDAITEAPFEQFNTIVYGHHMRDASMFGSLGRLKDTDYVKEHPRMELVTPEGKYHLEIWAFLNQPSDSSIYTTNFQNREDCEAYLQMIQGLAEYITSVEVSPDDRFVELSTCAYEYQEARYVVVAKMTPW